MLGESVSQEKVWVIVSWNADVVLCLCKIDSTYSMNKSLVFATYSALTFFIQEPTRSSDVYYKVCFFNDAPRKCAVDHGYRRGIKVSLADRSDNEIHWEDGHVTTVRYLERNYPKVGSDVVINGNTNGTVIGIFNLTPRKREIDNYVKIKSSTGNTFAYQYIYE